MSDLNLAAKGDRPVKYAHIVQTVFERPWAILPRTLANIVQLVRYRAEGGVLTAEEVRERLAATPQRQRRESAGLVAVIPIHGVIVPRASLFTEMSGAASVEGLQRAFREAMADPDVGGVLFDIDSPGGLVDAIPEFAGELRAARGQKPMVAVANAMAASAAYWLAAQADEVVVTPSSIAGSIGVYMAHEDASAFWEEVGIKTTLISAGKYKTEGNEFEPLSDEARGYFQQMTDDYYGLFVKDVAAGRGTTAEQVRKGYGEGRALTAKRAVTEGLADRVATFDDSISRLARQVATGRRPSASSDEVRYVAVEEATELIAEYEEVIEATEEIEGVAAEEEAAAVEAGELPPPTLSVAVAKARARVHRRG